VRHGVGVTAPMPYAFRCTHVTERAAAQVSRCRLRGGGGIRLPPAGRQPVRGFRERLPTRSAEPARPP
jgi:hypothetical protein